MLEWTSKYLMMSVDYISREHISRCNYFNLSKNIWPIVLIDECGALLFSERCSINPILFLDKHARIRTEMQFVQQCGHLQASSLLLVVVEFGFSHTQTSQLFNRHRLIGAHRLAKHRERESSKFHFIFKNRLSVQYRTLS